MQRLKDGWIRETLSRLKVPSHGTWYYPPTLSFTWRSAIAVIAAARDRAPSLLMPLLEIARTAREGSWASKGDRAWQGDSEGGVLGKQGGQSMAGGLAREGCWGPAPLCCLTAP